MRPHRLIVAVLLFVLGEFQVQADPAFLQQASVLFDGGKIAEAQALAQSVLDANPQDADALVVAGTAVLYLNMVPGRDDSIEHPLADPSAPPVYRLPPEGAQAVAAFWKRVPALDPAREYLWGDLAQMTFRAGDAAGALEYARQLLATAQPDPEAVQAASLVFVLNLDWNNASQVSAKLPGNTRALLYQGLEMWRRSQDGWRLPLKAFLDHPGADGSGSKLAGYLSGPLMRDSEAGFQQAIAAESTPAALIVRQKYVERYPNQFLARLDLARMLSQYGSFSKALEQYAEMDRLDLAKTIEERQSILFHRAWAFQGSGRHPEADRIWETLADAKDFYLRSAADWFLGDSAVRQGKVDQAKEWWSKVADEPSRSKYAFWSAQELKKLK